MDGRYVCCGSVLSPEEEVMLHNHAGMGEAITGWIFSAQNVPGLAGLVAPG
ncbi:MAG TPA: hypothetical protein VF914_17480 [Chloroflexia bacterium]|jgi:hypothetical protein